MTKKIKKISNATIAIVLFWLLIGSAFGLTAAFLWAVSTNIYKTQSEKATPLSIASLKMWMSFAVMAVLVWLPFRTTPFFVPFDTIIYLAASVTAGFVIGDVAYLTSQKRIGVSYAFPLAATAPILTYIIAIFVVDEVILLSRMSGIILAVIGVILISSGQASTSNDEENTNNLDKVGVFLALFTALCWAVESIFLQIGVADMDPIDANFMRMLFGAGIMAPLFLGSVRQGMPKPSRRAAKIILVGAFIGMTWASLLFTYAVKLVGASVTTVLGSTSPLFALPIAIIFLKEKFTTKSILGVLLTVVGIILVVLI